MKKRIIKIIVFVLIISTFIFLEYNNILKQGHSFGLFNFHWINYQGKIRLANRIIKSKSDFIKQEYKKFKEKHENCFIVSQDENYILVHSDYLDFDSYLYLIKDNGENDRYSYWYNPQIEYFFDGEKYKIELKDKEFLEHFNRILIRAYLTEDSSEAGCIFFIKQDDDFVFDGANWYNDNEYAENKYRFENRAYYQNRDIESLIYKRMLY